LNGAERRAARWYRLRGWRVLGANVWAGGNEVDLIVRRGRQLRFVEVKEKRGPRYGDPHEAVTEEKQRRVARAAETWLAARPELDGLAVGFDVVAVRDGRLERLADAPSSSASRASSVAIGSTAPEMVAGGAATSARTRTGRRTSTTTAIATRAGMKRSASCTTATLGTAPDGGRGARAVLVPQKRVRGRLAGQIRRIS